MGGVGERRTISPFPGQPTPASGMVPPPPMMGSVPPPPPAMPTPFLPRSAASLAPPPMTAASLPPVDSMTPPMNAAARMPTSTAPRTKKGMTAAQLYALQSVGSGTIVPFVV